MLWEDAEWRPTGRGFFVTGGDGKAESSYGEPWVNSNAYGTINKDTERMGKNDDDIYLSANFDKILSTELTEGKSQRAYRGRLWSRSPSLEMMKNKGTTAEAEQVNALYGLCTDTRPVRKCMDRGDSPSDKDPCRM